MECVILDGSGGFNVIIRVSVKKARDPEVGRICHRAVL